MKTKTQRQHECDTDNPQRPCCWAARAAWLKAMSDPQEVARRKASAAERDREIEARGGFITRGLD